jgi:hypothetical protein
VLKFWPEFEVSVFKRLLTMIVLYCNLDFTYNISLPSYTTEPLYIHYLYFVIEGGAASGALPHCLFGFGPI